MVHAIVQDHSLFSMKGGGNCQRLRALYRVGSLPYPVEILACKYKTALREEEGNGTVTDLLIRWPIAVGSKSRSNLMSW